MPDFKYFSLIRASGRELCSSISIVRKGKYGLVVLSLPLLCCSILLSGLSEMPT